MDDFKPNKPKALHPEWADGILSAEEIDNIWGTFFYFDEDTLEVLLDDQFYTATPDQMKIIKFLWKIFCEKGAEAAVSFKKIRENCFPNQEEAKYRHKFRSNLQLKKALIDSPRKGLYRLSICHF